MRFMTSLQEIRNFLTLDKFEKLLGKELIREKKGTISHRDFVGNLLEGLIIKFNTGKIVKYKFPLYTVRTMLVRKNIMKKDLTLKDGFVKRIEEFIQHWVIENGDDQDRWLNWLRIFYLEYNKIKDAYETSEYKSEGICLHIFAMDVFSKAFPIESIDSTKEIYIPGNFSELFKKKFTR